MFSEFEKKSPGSVTAKIFIPENNPFFDGHFDGFPVWPAVSQVDLVLKALEKALNCEISVVNIGRSKFTAMIRPNTNLRLALDWSENKANWQIQDDENTYSRGQLTFRIC